MGYIEVEVRTAAIVHGFDANNQEIVEKSDNSEFMKKLLLVERIQSVSEQYLLVSSSHGRVMYWEYKGSMDDIKSKMEKIGIAIG